MMRLSATSAKKISGNSTLVVRGMLGMLMSPKISTDGSIRIEQHRAIWAMPRGP